MAEEHGFQATEGHQQLCVNNCGFFGSPATKNMCSICYGDLCLKKSGDSSLFSTPLSVAPSSSVTAVQPIASAVSSQERETSTAAQPPQQPMNRCFACRKKVGLTGFKCRCGTTFCGTHRYPEKHGCTFDFKGSGREAIARDNPVIKADKLEKI